MDFEIVWNGTLDRQGLAPHATGYIGRSSLFICDTRAPKESAPLMLHDDERRLEAVRKYGHKQRKARAKLAKDLRIALKVKDERKDYHAAYYQQRKAAQQDLFSA